MDNSICKVDCTKCDLKDVCGGCAETNGRPFGENCIVALYCKKGETAFQEFKDKLITAFNELAIDNMDKVAELHALKGSFINIEYKLPNGQNVKFWNDNKIYLGNQLIKKNSSRCYGIAADENYLLVCEYSECGFDANIIVFKRWN